MNNTVNSIINYSYNRHKINLIKNGTASCGHKISNPSSIKFFDTKCAICCKFVLKIKQNKLCDRTIIKEKDNDLLSHKECYVRRITISDTIFDLCKIINENNVQVYDSTKDFITSEIDTCTDESCSNGGKKELKLFIDTNYASFIANDIQDLNKILKLDDVIQKKKI